MSNFTTSLNWCYAAIEKKITVVVKGDRPYRRTAIWLSIFRAYEKGEGRIVIEQSFRTGKDPIAIVALNKDLKKLLKYADAVIEGLEHTMFNNGLRPGKKE